MSKKAEYTAILLGKVQEALSEDVDFSELGEGDNLKDFLYALSLIVPCIVHNKLTGQKLNYLEMNHLANGLFCEDLQNSKN